MKLKENRFVGFVILSLLYIVAAVAGVSVFRAFDLPVLMRILLGDIAATLLIWLFSLLLNNASVYDPYWSVAPIVILPFIAVYYKSAGVGVYMLLIVVCLWGIRLTANWAYTFKNLNIQDWRYDMLKEKTGRFFPLISLVGIQIFPTLVVFCALAPAVLFLERSAFNALTAVGCVICLGAVLLQLISDKQMQRFRKQNANKGAIMRLGLWRYSRHPNYLGEILMWWGVYVVMLSARANMWYLFIGALLNTLMFLLISIPMAEKRLAGYKEKFDEYKAHTGMLLPVKR